MHQSFDLDTALPRLVQVSRELAEMYDQGAQPSELLVKADEVYGLTHVVVERIVDALPADERREYDAARWKDPDGMRRARQEREQIRQWTDEELLARYVHERQALKHRLAAMRAGMPRSQWPKADVTMMNRCFSEVFRRGLPIPRVQPPQGSQEQEGQ